MIRKLVILWAVLMTGVSLTGCSNNTLDVEGLSPEQKRKYEESRYPNINIVPKGETAQFTPAELAKKRQELSAARQEAQNGEVSFERDEEELRDIARTHSQEAIDKIEGN